MQPTITKTQVNYTREQILSFYTLVLLYSQQQTKYKNPYCNTINLLLTRVIQKQTKQNKKNDIDKMYNIYLNTYS